MKDLDHLNHLNHLTVDRVQEQKKRMEKYIRMQVQLAVNTFQEETGLTPESISIELIGSQLLSQRRPVYMVGVVSTNVQIFE